MAAEHEVSSFLVQVSLSSVSQPCLNEEKHAFQVYGGGVALALVICVPDWPWFNRQPPSWLPPQGGASGSEELTLGKSKAKIKR